MIRTATALTAITTATSLDDLCDAMNAAGDEINRLQNAGDDASDLIAAYSDAIEDCPLFGGDEPTDTTGVWSWDDTRLLVGEGWSGNHIIDRY